LHLQSQEEEEEDDDMDGSEDGSASPTASEDEQQEGNVFANGIKTFALCPSFCRAALKNSVSSREIFMKHGMNIMPVRDHRSLFFHNFLTLTST
jgi:hypothetical protein